MVRESMQIKASMCHMHLGDMAAAAPGLKALKEEAPEALQDLYLDAADTLLQTGHPQQVSLPAPAARSLPTPLPSASASGSSLAAVLLSSGYHFGWTVLWRLAVALALGSSVRSLVCRPWTCSRRCSGRSLRP